MPQKKVSSYFKLAGWYFLRFLTDIIGFFPLSVSLGLGYMIGRALYWSLGRKREAMFRSLDVAFPDMPVEEKRSIAVSNAVLIGQSYMEMLYYLRHPQALDRVKVEGREHLDQALKTGKGVIGLTGHFGNFTLMHYKLAHMGYPVAVMTRPMRNRRANDYFHNMRTGLGIKTVYTLPKKQAALSTIKALRANDLMIIQMDQDFRENGIWVEFFGKMASTAPGPVVFALRTGAVVLPMVIVKTGKNEHTIKIEPVYELKQRATKEETVHANVAELTKRIERWVRLYPHQWGWINERWKTQMPAEA